MNEDIFKYDGDTLLYGVPGKYDKLYVKEGTTKIGYHAFSSLDVKALYIPSSVKEIHEDAFENSFINEIHIDDIKSWLDINYPTASNCYSYYGLYGEEGRYMTYEDEDLLQLYIKEERVKNIVIPDGVTYIRNAAFFGMAIEEVFIPKSVKEIGYNIVERNYVTIVYEGSKDDWDKVIKHGDSLYVKFLDQTAPTIHHNGVVKKSAFASHRLDKLDLNGVVKISEYAFYKAKIGHIIWGNTLETIDLAAFSEASLDDMHLPDSLKEIGSSAFDGYHNLGDVVMGKSLLTIGEHAFFEATFTSLTFNEGLKKINYSAFSHIKGIKRIVFPSTLECIGCSAFYYNKDLEEVIFNQSIKELRSSSFSGNHLKVVMGSKYVAKQLIYSLKEKRKAETRMEDRGGYRSEVTVSYGEPAGAFEGTSIESFYCYDKYDGKLYQDILNVGFKGKFYFYSETEPKDNKNVSWRFNESHEPIPW